MKTKTPKTARPGRRLQSEGSFTLIETVIALAIVTFLIIEVAAVQGNSIVFSDYGRNITQATWLARRVMSEVEYYYHTKPFKELITSTPDQKFDEPFDEYMYSIEIKEWKFPFIKMLQNALGGGSSDPNKQKKSAGDDAGDKGTLAKQAKEGDSGGGADSGLSGMIETVIKQIFGDEPIFLTAHVAVSWPDGAQRSSSALTYLLTNQAKLDLALVQLKPVYDKLTKPAAKPGAKPGTPPAGQPGTPPPPGQPAQPAQPGADGGDGSGIGQPSTPPPLSGAADAGSGDGGQ